MRWSTVSVDWDVLCEPHVEDIASMMACITKYIRFLWTYQYTNPDCTLFPQQQAMDPKPPESFRKQEQEGFQVWRHGRTDESTAWAKRHAWRVKTSTGGCGRPNSNRAIWSTFVLEWSMNELKACASNLPPGLQQPQVTSEGTAWHSTVCLQALFGSWRCCQLPASTIHLHLDGGGNTVRITCDFYSAFKNIQPLLFAEKLQVIGVNSSIVSWITNYLTHRPQFVCLGSVLCDVVVSCTGAPQGTMLSSFLFTLYTTDFQYNPWSCHQQKILDGLHCCVGEGGRGEHRVLVDNVVEWDGLNHLQLTVTRPKRWRFI